MIGTLLGMALAVAGIARTPLAALARPRVHRHLPRPARRGDHSARRAGRRAAGGRLTGNNPYWLGAAALALLAAAYIGEIFRSGIQSVEPGQLEAARAIGFSYRESMRLVVVPRACGGCCRR